jgi:hypothetical protein
VAGKGDARSSAELAVKRDSWSKVCGQAARRLRPKVRRWRWTMREDDGQPLRLLAASLRAATSAPNSLVLFGEWLRADHAQVSHRRSAAGVTVQHAC